MYNYAMCSRQGDRAYNEDYIRMRENPAGTGALFVLADGLGGCGHGDIASKTAVESAISRYTWEDGKPGFFDRAFPGAQEALELKKKKVAGTRRMSTTLCMLELTGESACWAHIGDSRVYMFRDGEVLYQTLDHSVPQMLVNLGEIRPEEIRHHPDRNRLLKTIGSAWSDRAYVVSETVEVRRGDVWLLCSDGFWEYITEAEMCGTLKKAGQDMEHWLHSMEKRVRRSGAGHNMDNYSAICVCF